MRWVSGSSWTSATIARSSSRCCTRSRVVVPFSCGWTSIESTPSAVGLAQVVEAAVAGDPVEPGPRVDRPVVGEHRVVGGDEHLLEHVLGVLRRADQVPAEGQQARLVAVEEDLEGALVALAHRAPPAARPPASAAAACRRERTPLVLALVVREEASITRFIGRTRYRPKSSVSSLRNLKSARRPLRTPLRRLAHTRAFGASAGGGIRTPKPLRAAVLKTAVYPSSTTPAASS